MNGISLAKRSMPWSTQAKLGVLLLAVCWPLNWTLPGMRTAYLFFPLWLGYILVVDALVQARTASSLWTRGRRQFVWISAALILEPVNRWLGRHHFLQKIQYGDWRPVVSLSVGALICGFFWEMWNYYSNPKWIYHTPGAQFWYIFEMPLLGYAGYIPFALELYGLKNFLWRRAPELNI